MAENIYLNINKLNPTNNQWQEYCLIKLAGRFLTKLDFVIGR
jgi:hypothetical protein